MKLRLIHKLLIALFASAALVLLLIVWVAKVNIGRGFENFLAEQERALMPEFAAQLADWYADNGSWEVLQMNPRLFHQMLNATFLDLRQEDGFQLEQDFRPPRRPPQKRPPGKNKPPGKKPGGEKHRRTHPRGDDGALHRRVFLLDTDFDAVIGHSSRQFPRDDLIAIDVGGQTVGWLGVTSPNISMGPAERAFADRIQRVLWLGLALGLGVAAVLAWLLARHLGQPVSAVAGGMRKLASGDYSVEVDTRGGDEIARLSHDVNQLAHALSENRDARQRWMADMAHELRTPLAIIQGELEAISDGVRPFNEATLASIREEVSNLSQLIDDLHHLALSDSGALAYQMKNLDLVSLLESSRDFIRTRAAEKGISFSASIPSEAILVNGDDQRLRQLVRILLDNALLYTDAPGEIQVSLDVDGSNVHLVVNDSPPGVPESECERLFERLYRRESSRNRNSGGSGLGLSIARNIADTHGGSIHASPGSLGGLEVTFTMPVQI